MKRSKNIVFCEVSSKYAENEKNEITRLINEYADICISILERNKNDDDKF